MVELGACRDLTDGGREPVLHSLFGLGRPTREPAAGLLERRGPDEDHVRVWTLLPHEPRALQLDLKDHGLSSIQKLIDLLLRRPVEVTRVLGPFQEAALFNPALELVPGEEDVVFAVHFAGTGISRGRRDGVGKLGDRLERGPDQGRLSCSGGPGDDDQSSSHPKALIKRSHCPCVSPTRVLERLMPASLMTRVTLMRPMPLTARSISSTLAPLSSSEGSMSRS